MEDDRLKAFVGTTAVLSVVVGLLATILLYRLTKLRLAPVWSVPLVWTSIASTTLLLSKELIKVLLGALKDRKRDDGD